VTVLSSKTDGPAILHCEGFQWYTIQRPTALLLYVVKALVCGTLFEDRRTGCYRSTSDLLPPTALLFYTVKAFSGTQFKDRRPCYCTLWMLSSAVSCSKTDGPAAAAATVPHRTCYHKRPCYSTLWRLSAVHSSKTNGPATVRCEGSRLRYPVRRPTARLLLPLPFHIGPAATNPPSESTLDLLSQLPHNIVHAVYDLLLLLLLLYVYSHLLVST